jgi:hypothetical protein
VVDEQASEAPTQKPIIVSAEKCSQPNRDYGRFPPAGQVMTSQTDISELYREFTDALTEVLAENAVGLARRGRLARARAAVRKHPAYGEHEYLLAVESAFTQWEAMQNAGR